MSRKQSAYDWREVDLLLAELPPGKLPRGTLIEISERVRIPYGSISERRRRIRNLAQVGRHPSASYSRRWTEQEDMELLALAARLSQKQGRTALAIAGHLFYLLREKPTNTAGEQGANALSPAGLHGGATTK